MADELRLVFEDETVWDGVCPKEKDPNVKHPSRVEVGRMGLPRLIFYTRNDDSRYFCHADGKVQVEARVNCLFRDEKLVLSIILDRDKRRFTQLAMGGRVFQIDLLPLWEKGKLVQSFDLLNSHLPHQAALFEKIGINDELSAVNWAKNLALRVIFLPIRGEEGALTPVFHSRPRLRKRSDLGRPGLKAFGASVLLRNAEHEPELQLAQFPESIFRPRGELSRSRKWLVAVRGMPYHWGLEVWNSLLAEQVRVTDLDIPHASFFSPLLQEIGKIGTKVTQQDEERARRLGWHLLLESEEGSPRPVSHSLRLFAWKEGNPEKVEVPAESTVPVQFPLLRDHEGKAVMADLRLESLDRPEDDFRYKKSPPGAPGAQGPIDPEDDLAFIRRMYESPGLALGLDSGWLLAASGQASSQPDSVLPPHAPVRVGALDVRFSDQSKRRADDQPLELRWHFVPSTFGASTEEAYQARDVVVDLSWLVASASPGGQDDLPDELHATCDEESLRALNLSKEDREEREIECGFQREPPLVIPLRRVKGKKDATDLILKVKEHSRQGDTRRVDLRLERPAQPPPDINNRHPQAAAAPLAAQPGQTAAASAESVPAPSLAAAALGGIRAGSACKPAFPDHPEKPDDSNVPAQSMDRVVVLDREPFLAASVSFPSLGTIENPAAGNEVANWSSYGSDAGTWHIRFPNAQSFCLILPPQGVGETMEKSKDQGLDPGKTADFRLSPPALLSMRETFFRQNFPEAPWNLRRLLSDPGRELPGAQLESLQYELLYGLSCRADYPFMRLAELSALVGNVMGPLEENPRWIPLRNGEFDQSRRDEYKAARKKWAGTARRTRQRLGIFELWDIRTLDTLELKEGVTCWIRQMPGDQGLQGDKTDNPRTGRPKTLPEALVQVSKADLANPFPQADGGASSGLKGGVTWGFESRNVYQAVLRPIEEKWPRSSGAELKETRLSALGGYGHQMAAFDNWRTKILADVSMGRTYSYTLERIGRIGVWWNRAKHVIIYQRTVVPSHQFDGDQNKHAGRAVLRKVEEYVEIIQNSRNYPDNSEGFPRATGFVTACSFSDDPNQVIRFRVKSSWGSDIGRIGWKVPIWRPGENPSDLYPKPVVHLGVLASVDGESVPRKVTIADPENLFFFTSTEIPPEAFDNPSVDLSNTDAWRPVEGVDFVDQARPRPAQDSSFENGSLRQSSAGDTVLPVGFRPCTFLIEPAEHTVDLLANRRGDPMGAMLSSVTMCRADLQDKVSDLSKIVETTRVAMASLVQERIASLPAEASQFNPDVLKAGLAGLCSKASAEVEKALSGPSSQLDIAVNQLAKAKDLITALDEQAAENITLGARRIAAYPAALVDELREKRGQLEEAIKVEADKALGQVALLPSPVPFLVNTETVLHLTRSQIFAATEQLRGLVQGLDLWLDGEGLPRLAELTQRLQGYRSQLWSILQKIREMTESGSTVPSNGKNLAVGLGPSWVKEKLQLKDIAATLERVEAMLAGAENLAAAAKEKRDGFKVVLQKRLRGLQAQVDELQSKLDLADEILEDLRGRIAAAETELFRKIENFVHDIRDKAIEALTAMDEVDAAALKATWENAVTAQAENLRKALNDYLENVRSEAESLIVVFDRVESFIPSSTAVQDAVKDRCAAFKKRVEDLLAEIGADLGLEAQAAEVRQFLERLRDQAAHEIEARLGGGIKAARQLLGVIEAKEKDVLNLVRAFGKPPEVSGLQFDRPEIAFFYNEIKDHVDVTPVIARAAQAGAVLDALKPFGVDLPVQQLAEQLIPASLKNFDLSSILPNIAGIPLQNLFSGLKMPDLSSDAVKVRHGVDPQNRRAWVNTDVNFEIPSNAPLFAVGPLAVSIRKPHFKASARMEVDPKGIQQRSVNGHLSGDWQLQIGGFELITFKETPLEFDDAGRVRFGVEPRNVILAPALSFINDLMTKVSPGGLTIRFDGDGVVSTLDLPIPDTQIGAFGFAGLRLGAALALRFGGDGFNIGVTASLGRRDAPFTLTVFILGGGGYLELGSRYHPATGRVTATADLAIAASASLAIALGPIQGGVAVYVGVTAQYDSGKGGGLVVGLLFMIRGHVSVLSIASATIVLRLDAQYQGGELIGRGHLEIKIKICWCFTLEVSESVTYTLGRVGSQNNEMRSGPQPVAQLASLGMPAVLPASSSSAAEKPDGLDKEELKKRVNVYLEMLV